MQNSNEQFPEDFLWGVATAAHQVEGETFNDWRSWEIANASYWAAAAGPRLDYGNGTLPMVNWLRLAPEAINPDNYISGRAIDNWNLWREDIGLAESLGMTSLRFSVEWSRIQPNPYSINKTALAHYVQIAQELRSRRMEPIVTLHHFTKPTWFSASGGWERNESPIIFEKFTQIVGRAMSDAGISGLRYTVINEPEQAVLSHLRGTHPPGKKNPYKYLQVIRHMAEGHNVAFDSLKDIDASNQVASALSVWDLEPKQNRFERVSQSLISAIRPFLLDYFRDRTVDQMDFIGVNHYMHNVIDAFKIYRNFGMWQNSNAEPRSDLGWYLHPESLHKVLLDVSRHKKPVMVTESGVATQNDKVRERYLVDTINAVKRAIDDGVDVRGFLHWTLVDNFEWPPIGWMGKFGLVAVDRETMERTPKPSAYLYRDIIKRNGVIDGN